ncbi:MAG: chorismate synthase [Bacteroidota bacterium]
MNTLGKIFTITSFGESHGKAVGAVIDGCPSNIKLDLKKIQNELNRRKPGQSKITTQRKEEDEFEIISGVLNSKTLGSPITLIIKNNDAKSSDYEWLKNTYRPGHADFTYDKKYGIQDVRGGGRSSARITAGWVAAGAIAKQFLELYNIEIVSWVNQIADCKFEIEDSFLNENISSQKLNSFKKSIEKSIVRCPSELISNKMVAILENIKKEGDTVGGCIQTAIYGLPIGLGEPVFGKFQAELAHALLNINATKGFELGKGFDSVSMKGSEYNDVFIAKNKITKTLTNNSGGLLGGISNSMPVYFNLAFKPLSTIFKEQQSIDRNGNQIKIKAKGRHDPCAVPRAVPIVEALTACVVADLILQNRSSKI